MIVRKEDILETAVEKAKAAAEFSSSAWDEVVEHIAPLLDAAAKKVTPVADGALEAAKTAKRRAAGFAADTVERIQPTVNTTLQKVVPAVDRAQQAVQKDLLPHLIAALQHAATTPAGSGAREILTNLDERADASMTALKGELVKSKKKSTVKTIATVATVGAILGALVVAVRVFLGSREDWEAYEPDEPYIYPDDDYEIDEVMAEDEVSEDSDEDGEAEEAEAEEATAPYGEGSYAGANPPEGFTIKGNERSMKYHVPEAAGYARCSGNVWFSSEEAAQAAGFVRSQR